jgi:hypothetical protein
MKELVVEIGFENFLFPFEYDIFDGYFEQSSRIGGKHIWESDYIKMGKDNKRTLRKKYQKLRNEGKLFFVSYINSDTRRHYYLQKELTYAPEGLLILKDGFDEYFDDLSDRAQGIIDDMNEWVSNQFYTKYTDLDGKLCKLYWYDLDMIRHFFLGYDVKWTGVAACLM